MPESTFRPFAAPARLARYVSDTGLNLVDADAGDEPWGLMYVREPSGAAFAAVRTGGMDSEQVDRCIATAIAHSVLDHRGDFVHAPDGRALVAPSRDQAAAAVRYGALLLAEPAE